MSLLPVTVKNHAAKKKNIYIYIERERERVGYGIFLDAARNKCRKKKFFNVKIPEC